MFTKNALRDIFARYDFRPLKRFGESYLIDANIKDKILKEAGVVKGDTILEIGPGFGALTMDLAATGAKVWAVEKDEKALSIFSDIIKDDLPKLPDLKLISGDILKFDIGTLARRGRLKVIGNLPYYITTDILEYLIENRSHISFALILVQREVASRLLAAPGTKDRSSISCFTQYHARPEYIHTVKRTAFYPQPEVDSSLIKLKFLTAPAVDVRNEALFFKIVRGAFNQRRKTIINSLSRREVLDMPKERLSRILEAARISPNARPESLSLADFARIANSVISS